MSYLLNLPSDLKEKLEEIAKDSERTLKGQIILFLKKGVEEFEQSITPKPNY